MKFEFGRSQLELRPNPILKIQKIRLSTGSALARDATHPKILPLPDVLSLDLRPLTSVLHSKHHGITNTKTIRDHVFEIRI